MISVTQGIAKKKVLREIIKNRWTYVFLIPGLVFLGIFSYYPMYGILLAFKDFEISRGIVGSLWAKPLFSNFTLMLNDQQFYDAFFNTFRMGFWYIVTGFPAPIILALLLNELRNMRFKKVLQTLYTFPNFLSWVIVGGIMVGFLSYDGLINAIIRAVGFDSVEFLTNYSMTRPILYLSSIWKSVGWGSIIYLAAIAGINPELYEASSIDGANRFHEMLHITWPGIKPTAVILLILSFASMTNMGFDQILNMVNPVVRDAAQVLDTYIYRRTFQMDPNYGFSTAVGLSKSIINFIFLLSANKIIKLLGEEGIM